MVGRKGPLDREHGPPHRNSPTTHQGSHDNYKQEDLKAFLEALKPVNSPSKIEQKVWNLGNE